MTNISKDIRRVPSVVLCITKTDPPFSDRAVNNVRHSFFSLIFFKFFAITLAFNMISNQGEAWDRVKKLYNNSRFYFFEVKSRILSTSRDFSEENKRWRGENFFSSGSICKVFHFFPVYFYYRLKVTWIGWISKCMTHLFNTLEL